MPVRILLTVTVCLSALFFAGAWPAEAAVENRQLKIGFVYVSPVGDAGWSYTHDQARRELAKEPGISTFIAENVPEGADSERVIRSMSKRGCDIIITTSFGFMEATLKVAGEFPGITYLHCAGYKTAPNVSAYFGRMYQARFLSGMVAGSMTKSNSIGYVAAYPIPEVIRGINAFTLGVRQVNPEAVVRVSWTETWYDPVTEKDAAAALLRGGADVIAQHQDSTGPQEAAQEAGAYSIGYSSDMSAAAPAAHLVAPVWNWTPFYKEVANAVRKGTWTSGTFWPGIETGIVDISAFGPMVPTDVRQRVLECRKAIMEGAFAVFRGPVLDRDGRVRIAEGAVPSDQQLLEMDWFVPGVVGESGQR